MEFRQSISPTGTPIEDDATLLEGEDADARPPSALQPARDLPGRKIQALEDRESRAHRERKLRSRAETGMRRNCLRQMEGKVRFDP